MRKRSLFDALRTPPDRDPPTLNFSPHPSYESYLRIHKVLVGPKTALELETIYDHLKNESLPRYLSVAGWAAVESALTQPHCSASYRNNLLEMAEECWQRAMENQLLINQSDKDYLHEADGPFRYALDLAHLPLIQAMISGDVTDSTRKRVALDTLNIAEANMVQLELAIKAGDDLAVSDHIGIGHEGNGLLAFHSLDSAGLFAIPSMARADSGHHHRDQTYDMLIIQQKWGNITDMTPCEIKAKASKRDRNRYKALLLRGRMHLSLAGNYTPQHTLKAFSSLFNGTQTKEEKAVTNHVRQTALDMYWLYKKGPSLGSIATKRSMCKYRDGSELYRAYPEIAPQEFRTQQKGLTRSP